MVKNKHDSIIRSLEERLKKNSKYAFIVKNHFYYRHNNTYEIDLLARTRGYALYFEVKSNNGQKQRKCAKTQLDRVAKLYASKGQRNFYFCVYGDKYGDYVIRRYKPNVERKH